MNLQLPVCLLRPHNNTLRCKNLLSFAFLLALISLVNTHIVKGQEIPVEFYGVEEGLPEIRVDHLSLLNDGKLFIGTAGRATVYDGYNFKIIDKKRKHWIINGCKDPEGTTWVTNIHGSLYGFDGKNMFDHPVGDSMERLANTRMSHISLAFDTSKTAYLGINRGKYYVKAFQDGSVQRISTEELYPPNSAYVERRYTETPFFGSTYRDAKSDSGFVYLDGKVIFATDAPLSNRVHYARNDSLEVISVGYSLFFIRDGKVSQRHFGIGINKLLLDPYGRLWIAHTKGASCINLRKPRHIQSVVENRMCTSLALDLEGHLWLGTTNGLFKVLSPFITNYSEANGKKLCAQSTADLLLFKNKVTVVDKVGIFHYQGINLEVNERYKAPYSLSLATSGANGFWVLRSLRPYFYDNDGNVFSKAVDRRITGMASYSKDSTAWYNQSGIVSQVNEKCEVIRSVDIETLDWGDDMPERPRIKVVGMDQFNPYISIEMKLFVYEGDSLRRIYRETKNSKLQVINRVKSVGDLTLVGTKINGLWILHTDTFYHLGTHNGLQSDNVHFIAEENDSTWWLATSYGLHRVTYSIKGKDFQYDVKVIDKSHGLLSSSVSEMLIHNDTLWMSTRGGISCISLDIYNSHQERLQQPNISWLRVNGLDSTYTAPMEFKPSENQLSFGFKAVTFRPVKRKTYAYRLIGQSQKWRITTDTMVNYEALPAGDFVFEVRSLGDDLETFSPSSQVKFSIAKPFWQQAWFIIVAVLLAQFIAGMGVWLFNRSKRRRLSLEKSVLTAELKALRAQLNPHFMFNALGAIQGSILKGSNEEALQNIGKLAHLMRKMLHTTRNKRTSLKDAVEVLRLYLDLELVRQPNGFSYQIECDDSCTEEIETLNIPPSIIQPFVENAVLHGALKASEKGTVAVSFSQHDEYIQCTIADNGPGYYQSQKKKNPNHRSLGLTIVKEQIELLNMDLESKISLSIEEHQGTVVTVQTPIDF